MLLAEEEVLFTFLDWDEMEEAVAAALVSTNLRSRMSPALEGSILGLLRILINDH